MLTLPNADHGGTEVPEILVCDQSGHSVRRALPVRLSGLAAVRAKRLSGFGQGSGEPFRVKDGFVVEHKVGGARQFDGDDGVGFELVAVHPSLQLLGQRLELVVVAFGDDGSFAKGPTQVGVAEFGPAQALDLAGAGDGAFDQATVREEIFDGGEALDVADLVENGQAQGFTDARDGLEEDILTASDAFGLALQFFVELEDLLVEVADHGHVVFEGDLAQGMVFSFEQLLLPGVADVAGLFGWGAVVGQLMGVDARQVLADGHHSERHQT